MVDEYIDDQQAIEAIDHRLVKKCRVTNVSIYKLIENDNQLTFLLIDLFTGHDMFINIDKQRIAGITKLRKTELIYGWLTKCIKLLVNERYGGEEVNNYGT